MTWHGWLSLGLMVAAFAGLAFTRVASQFVMLGVLVVLNVTGILTPSEALAGFSNPGLFTVAAMFILAAGIHASGGTDMVVRQWLGRPRSARQAQFRLCVPVALFSAILNNTPLVATMIPAVTAWSRKIDVAPSKLMIPLSYAAILGGTLTMIGTSTNLAVNGQYQILTGDPGFSLFSITIVGLPVAIVSMLFMLWWFPTSLPDHSDEKPFDNPREFTLEVAVAHGGPLVGKTIEQAELRGLRRLFLVEIERDGTIITAVGPEEKLKGGDRLVFAGETEAISILLRINGIVPSISAGQPLLEQDDLGRQLVQAVLSPHSNCIGETIRDSGFRARYGAVVLAVARDGDRVPGNLGSIRLQAGDTLLLEASSAFVGRERNNKEFLLINDLNTEQPRHQRAALAWAILLCVVILATFGVLDILNAALLGAAAMLITRCCSARQAQNSLDINVIVTIGASFALGSALDKTGVAAFIARHVIALSNGDPWLILILTYVTVMFLTEFITNNAAAILMVPIALQVTGDAGLHAQPYMFAIMMGASASFATPIGYQTNLMVYGPGSYRFVDFLRVGIPMNVVVGIVSILAIGLLIPLV